LKKGLEEKLAIPRATDEADLAHAVILPNAGEMSCRPIYLLESENFAFSVSRFQVFYAWS
jgi:hypothetical protein